ncbi:DUF3168 domain-containing protein [Woodsholea maritima]|uniref:DUF3168 domain-containing protein n=1 Tax=Woodsholea maritima TaxID=240237 RepID=UPI000374F52B|nr:DUF3168 domain-containing protein [Woodsholea maritima]
MSAEAEFQRALVSALKADARLYPLLGEPPRVVDEGGRGALFPYLRVGQSTSEPLVQGGLEGGGDLIDHRLSLEVWTRWGGLEGSKQAVSLVRTCLQGLRLTLSPSGQSADVMVLYTDSFRQADLRTHLGVVRLRSIVI